MRDNDDQLDFDDKKASENISKLLKGKKMNCPFKKIKRRGDILRRSLIG